MTQDFLKKQPRPEHVKRRAREILRRWTWDLKLSEVRSEIEAVLEYAIEANDRESPLLPDDPGWRRVGSQYERKRQR